MVDRAKLVQCNIRDIGDRKQAEERLRESENRFRDISYSMADWIWEVDKKGRYTFVSDTVKNILGYDSHELIGKTPFDLMPGEEGAKRKTSFFKTASRSLPINHFENWYLAKDGTKVCSLTNGVPIFDGDKELKGYRGVDKDITRQKQNEAEKASIEEQLRQAQKMEFVGRLAGGVAHDYNNALSVIMGYTELAMDKMDLADPLRDDLNEVLKAAKRATDITRQLLAFARKQTIAPKVLNLNENVESMLKMVRRLIGEDITLAWVPGANLSSVKMDPSQIDQILANLCINARDAISGVGKITIETKKATFDTAYCADHHGFIPGEFIMLAVSDNGCGMDKEILNNIFEPFFTTKDVDKGTGLGLSTVYGIVKQNKGFINVYSEPGTGTTIRIYLPQHEDNAIDIQRHNTEDIPSGHGETIMVVEDDPSILKLAERILKELGYIVLTENRPKGAINRVKEHAGKIHLLLTDVIMPEMNGLELVNRLKSRCPALKYVFMSGYTADTIAHHGVLDKGMHFIQKPFSKENLAKTVRTALGEVTSSVQG
ncbi:MAG: PAS domain S-box protein [Proteobacteria bacterium]|nr:PAS domain S-box protein [Pseudomonadota bacterium]